MTINIRRVVTGHDANGKAVVKIDTEPYVIAFVLISSDSNTAVGEERTRG